ncbi:MAG TPA: DALR anticodon-binding domain-containing protein [Trebonia sp.]|nr:DALR anticodon-binding domain-containing protein [Trebonia sp.]
MITRDLRRAIARSVAATGYRQAGDPGLRPTGTLGQYAASIALTLGANPRETAETLAGTLAEEHWVKTAAVTGPGYLTITVTPEALAGVADAVISAGPACVTSDALAGHTVPAATQGDPLAASTWEEARAALAARLTARLAAAAGAAVAELPATERVQVSRQPSTDAGGFGGWSLREAAGGFGGWSLREAAAFAGRDAVLFTLARAIPGKPLRIDPETMAKHVPGNPAYAVRYAHARAASGVRWATASSSADTIRVAEASTLLDALSWLPERVAIAARRGRPDEFAHYLEDLARVTVDVLSSVSHPGAGGTGREKRTAPGSDKLTLAQAARTGLAAGLGLVEVSAPDRL